MGLIQQTLIFIVHLEFKLFKIILGLLWHVCLLPDLSTVCCTDPSTL